MKALNTFWLMVITGMASLVISCESKVKKQIKVQPKIKGDTTFVNNDLSTRILGRNVFKADTIKVKRLFARPVQLSIEKKQGEGELYYWYTFTSKPNKLILFYNPGEGFYVENAEINDKDFVLNKKVSIDMDKNDFLKLLSVDSLSVDTIHVTNDEYSLQSTFIFRNQKLKQVKVTQTME